MIPRYATPSMTAVWSDEARWSAALQVELAVLDAQAATGEVPADAVAVIRAKAKVDVARINELERTTDHDVVAFVNQLAESVGAEGRWIHHGLTSSDVVDTALALQMREAAGLLDAGLATLLATIIRRAREERDTIMIGRTHGMHAEPTTMGAKMANWAFEVARARERIALAAAEAATGKISGPVGTYSQIAPEIEQIALAALGLRAPVAVAGDLDRSEGIGLGTGGGAGGLGHADVLDWVGDGMGAADGGRCSEPSRMRRQPAFHARSAGTGWSRPSRSMHANVVAPSTSNTPSRITR